MHTTVGYDPAPSSEGRAPLNRHASRAPCTSTRTASNSNATDVDHPETPTSPPPCTDALKLRPHQETCPEPHRDAPNDGSAKIGVSPTGAGKTGFVSLLEQLQSLSGNRKANRSLVVFNASVRTTGGGSAMGTVFRDWAAEIEQRARYTTPGFTNLCVIFLSI